MQYNLPRDYLSASQISMYLRCGKQYEFRYVEGIQSPPAIFPMQGSAVHATNEHYYNDVINGNQPFTPKQAAEFAMFSFEEDAGERDFKLKADIKDETAKILEFATGSYLTNVAPLVKPISTEEEIRFQSRCGVTLLGYLDLRRKPFPWETQLYPNGDQVLVDYKVTGKKWSEAKLYNSLQFMIYSLATGVGRVEVHNIARTLSKPKKNKLTTEKQKSTSADIASNVRLLRHNYTGDEYPHIENLIEGVVNGISKGVFMPCDPDGWNCSKDWCGYWHLCRGK